MNAGARVVHVYYADRRELPDSVVAAWVTEDDRRRLTPTMVERRRAEFLAARALLRYALARHVGSSATQLRIELARDGKPQCSGGPAISVSHSHDLVVCAVAAAPNTGAVGVDVEATKPRDAGAIAERFFTAAEAQWIGGDPERFRSLWVLKEAYFKALGVGIGGGLDALECRIEPPVVAARASGGAPQLALLAGRDCHLGVAALGEGPFTIDVERWAPSTSADLFGPFKLLAKTA